MGDLQFFVFLSEKLRYFIPKEPLSFQRRAGAIFPCTMRKCLKEGRTAMVQILANQGHTNSIQQSPPTGGTKMATAQAPALDMTKLNNFIGQFVTDLGASVHAGMVVIGEKLGLYKVLAEGPVTAAELAAKTRTDERYLREWLSSQA